MMHKREKEVSLNDITIRNHLQPGDLGYVIYLHGDLYKKEHGFNLTFEAYVAESMAEFYQQYNPVKDRTWICEHAGQIIGSLFLMHRGQAAQLRYFIIRKEYRGLGLGKWLMRQYISSLEECGYSSSFLWTVCELKTAISLYKRHGFVLTEEEPSTVFGKPLIKQKYELTVR